MPIDLRDQNGKKWEPRDWTPNGTVNLSWSCDNCRRSYSQAPHYPSAPEANVGLRYYCSRACRLEGEQKRFGPSYQIPVEIAK